MRSLPRITKKGTALLMSAIFFALATSGCQTGSQPQESQVVSISESINEAPSIAVSEPEPEPEPEPNNDWEFDAPENHGADGELLDQMHTALGGTQIHSAVTVKDGVIIDEYYQDGYDETSIFPVHSASKSFTSALIGIAIEEGLISGIDAKLSEYLPQATDTDKADITLRHLLTHTGGFEWYEWGGGYTNFFEWRGTDNWVDYILNRQMVAQPGAVFNYTTGGTHLLTAVLQQVTGQTALEYGQEHIFGPMGMDSVEWGTDPQGVMDGGNGLLMNARDMAKFGQMFLNGGKWHDRQLVPETWVEQSTGLQYARPGSDSYGYQWWLRSLGAGNYDTYFAMGAWGQFIFVVPELNLVTVMTSTHKDNTYLPRTYFSDYIIAACTRQQESE